MKGKINGGQLCAERGDHFRGDFPIVLKSGKKVPVDLTPYKFKKQTLLKAIDEASGKSLCHKDDSDRQYEKVERKIEYKFMVFALILFFVWILCSLVI